MAAIKVLLVGDGPYMDNVPPRLGVSFLKDALGHYTQDKTDDTFTVSELIYLLTNATPSISVDTAHRRNDPNATFPNFVFTPAALAGYDVLWIVGYEGYNYQVPIPGSPISPAEIQAIAEFMQDGGGVFATGDHEGMGSYICGQIPRVRSMRMWYGRPGDIPAGAPVTAVNSQGQTVSAVNWPGASAGGVGRADTLRMNPSDPAGQFEFDDQSDAIPQPLSFPGGIVHAVLRGEQASISRFPDHMHEGEVVTPADTSQVLTINGQHFTEYPSAGAFQPVPSIIATGTIVGGHSTLVEGSACEQANFTSDSTPTVARPLGILCAYDGHGVGVGRVLTDSSFHHCLDLNLVGDPCGSTTDRQQGFGPAYAPPAAGSVLADLQAFYVNAAVWLARTDQSFYVTVAKSTFGFDEATDGFPSFAETFWLVVNGFSLTAVQDAADPALTGPFAQIGGIAITPGTPVGEAGAQPGDPQRVAIPYSVRFSAASATAFPPLGHAPVEMVLAATLTIGSGTSARSFAAETVFSLVAGADPYFQNVNPNAGNAFYLSQDLAVFTVNPHENPAPVLGVEFDSSLDDAPHQYITGLLGALNGDPGLTTPSSPDPFPATFPSQFVTTGDSSVTPGTSAHPNYNFCVARVRLNGAQGTSAQNVRVFFRLFVTQTSDTDFEPGSTYASVPDAQGLPAFPLPGPDHQTTPFFASSDSALTDYGPGGPNIRTVTVTGTQDATWAYFGCYLDVYEQSLNLKMSGTHHCVVAQLAYDGAPIVNSNGLTASPGSSDKLAQRNLQVTFSGNPSSTASRVIPQTFDLRPGPVPAQTAGQLLNYPDELMISWGNTPPGSVATILWPQVQASDVVETASRLYGTPQLTATGQNTLQCAVSPGVTYVPVPAGVPENVAGLFTVTLPPGVIRGQEFDILVRRISSRQPPAIIQTPETVIVRPPLQENWRYVVGTFQVKIPVRVEASLLPAEEDTYAILLWRFASMSPANRWHPVFERYISLIADRVEAFGGHPGRIKPSPAGAHNDGHPHHPSKELTGKVTGLVYDRFGDFSGFVLTTERGEEHAFYTTDAPAEPLIRSAWAERILLSVLVSERCPTWPISLILRNPAR